MPRPSLHGTWHPLLHLINVLALALLFLYIVLRIACNHCRSHPPPDLSRQCSHLSTPIYSTPAHGTPAYRTPVFSTSAYRTPVYSTPAYRTPAYGTPAYRTPVISNPVYSTPVYYSPGYFSVFPTCFSCTLISANRKQSNKNQYAKGLHSTYGSSRPNFYQLGI